MLIIYVRYSSYRGHPQDKLLFKVKDFILLGFVASLLSRHIHTTVVCLQKIRVTIKLQLSRLSDKETICRIKEILHRNRKEVTDILD